jgi:hypothetical protein
MIRHPWAPALIVARPEVGPATLGHIDAVLRFLEAGGFPIEMAHHALHVLGSRVFGFTQDPFNDSADVRPDRETQETIARTLAATWPNVGKLAMAASHDGPLGGCDDDFEFAFGLDLILDGLERARPAARAAMSPSRRSRGVPPAAPSRGPARRRSGPPGGPRSAGP